MEEDAPEYYHRLLDILEKADFEWVITEVREHIAQGRPVIKEVQAFEAGDILEVSEFPMRPRRRRRTALVTTEPFNDRERLDILLSAIEAALLQRFELEAAVLGALEAIQRIEFIPDDVEFDAERADRRRHHLNSDRLRQGESIYPSLRNALTQIREEVNGGS